MYGRCGHPDTADLAGFPRRGRLPCLGYLICVATGAAAMPGCRGGGAVIHTSGRSGFWGLVAVFVSSAGLATVRWAEDYPLIVRGVFRPRRGSPHSDAPALAILGAAAHRLVSWVLRPVADGLLRGQRQELPLWREPPQIAFWLLPSLVGYRSSPYVLVRHPSAACPVWCRRPGPAQLQPGPIQRSAPPVSPSGWC